MEWMSNNSERKKTTTTTKIILFSVSMITIKFGKFSVIKYSRIQSNEISWYFDWDKTNRTLRFHCIQQKRQIVMQWHSWFTLPWQIWLPNQNAFMRTHCHPECIIFIGIWALDFNHLLPSSFHCQCQCHRYSVSLYIPLLLDIKCIYSYVTIKCEWYAYEMERDWRHFFEYERNCCLL